MDAEMSPSDLPIQPPPRDFRLDLIRGAAFFVLGPQAELGTEGKGECSASKASRGR